MLLAGDEFRRTQLGNNNAYCQDNETTWLDWSRCDRNADLVAFVQRLTGLRDRYPILRRTRFLTGAYDEALDVKDVTWIDPAGTEIDAQTWGDTRCFAMRVDGRAQPTGVHRLGQDATLLIIFNSRHEDVAFVLPETSGGTDWSLLIDTNRPEGDESIVRSGETFNVAARSLALFVLRAG
jgi:glycogen operon protein